MRPALPHACIVAVIASIAPLAAQAGEVRANVRIDAAGSWLPRLPPMTLSESVDTPARTVPSRSAPLAGGVFQLQSAIALDLVVDDRFIVPLIGAAIGGTVGSARDVATSIDGSTFTAHPANALMLRFDLPGFGVRFHDRRWAFEGRLIPAFEYWTLPAQLTPEQNGSLETYALSLRADLSLCFRADATSRVCAFVAPSLWEFGALNGGSAGLRVEFGP